MGNIGKERYLETIQACHLFANAEPHEIDAILSMVEPVKLAADQVLFEQGDQSSDAYIVVSGKLAALAHAGEGDAISKHVADILPNQIVGEMSLLSNMPRSLTIKSEVESELLKLPYQQFMMLCEQHPKILIRISRVIVSRVHKVITLYAKPQVNQYTAIIAVDENVSMTSFMQALRKHCNYFNTNVLLPKDLYGHEQPAELLEACRRQFRHIIYPMKLVQANTTTFHELVRYADNMLVLSHEDSDMEEISSILLELQQQVTYHALRVSLVVMHSGPRVMPKHTRHLIESYDFHLHHHIFSDDPEGVDYRRLVRIVTGHATGLVLGGGGVRGWVEIGVIKALIDHQIEIDMVGGTSVGASVGACYLMSQNYTVLREKFEVISSMVTKGLTWSQLSFPIVSIFSGKKPLQIIQDAVGKQCIEDLFKPYFSISFNLTQRQQVVHKRGQLFLALRASGSLPGIVPPLLSHNNLLVDGGVYNNLPVDVMRDFLGKGSRVIAVSLSDTRTIFKEEYRYPSSFSMKNAFMFKMGFKNRFKVPSLVDVLMESFLAGASSRESENCLNAEVLIRPALKSISALQRNIDVDKFIGVGYQATCKALQQFNKGKKEQGGGSI